MGFVRVICGVGRENEGFLFDASDRIRRVLSILSLRQGSGFNEENAEASRKVRWEWGMSGSSTTGCGIDGVGLTTQRHRGAEIKGCMEAGG
jgi:hypothetical protein